MPALWGMPQIAREVAHVARQEHLVPLTAQMLQVLSVMPQIAKTAQQENDLTLTALLMQTQPIMPQVVPAVLSTAESSSCFGTQMTDADAELDHAM